MKIVILICMIFISYFEGMQGSETSETSSFNSQGALGAAGNLAQFNNNPTGGSNKTAPLKSAANSVLSEDVMKNQQFAQTKRQINEGKSPQNQVPINKLGSGSRVIATPINLSTALKFKADETTPTDPKKLAQMGIAGVTLASTAQTLTLPETQSARANAEKILKKNELDLSQLASPINTETLKQNTSNDITPQDQVSNLAVSTVTPVSKIASVSKVTPASGEPVSGFESIKDLIKNKPGDYNNLLTAISFDEQKLSEENRGWFSSSPKITPQEIKQTDTIDKFKTKYNYNQENFDKAFIAFNKDIISLQAKIEKLKANTTLRNNLEALLKKAEDARNTMVKERVDFLTKKINETPIAKVFPIYDGYLTALKAARINPIYEQYKQIYTDVVENLNKITEAVAQLKKDPSLEGGSKNPEIDSIKIAIEKAPVELILDPLKDQVIAQLQFDLAKAEGSEAAYQKIQDEANSKVDELWSAYLIALKNDPNNPNLEIDPIHIALTDFKNELDSEVQKNSNLESNQNLKKQSTDLINYVKSLLKYYDDNQTLPDPNEKGDSEKPAALNIKEKNFKKSPYADTFQLYSTIIMKLQKNMGKKLDIAKKVDELLGDDKSLINLNKEIAWIKSQLQGNPTQADLKEAWNEKFDNTVKIPEGNLKKIYEGMLTELEQRAKVATENSSYYKLKRALLNIFGGKENATQAVRTAVWNTPGAVGEVGNALQVYTKDSLASVGIDWDKLSPEAKKAIATVLAAGAALIIKIQANNSLTADEKKKYLDDGLGAMMRDVTNIAIADQFGVSVDVVASGDAEAIATEAAMNKIIKSLTPEDTTGYNYDYSAVNSKNYTSNLDKFTSENDHILNPTSSTKSSSTTKSSPGKSYPSLADLEADNF